ncbi:hypothetical protein SerAS12_2782 [Serratia sp. AS12]|uniref:hypothetical protein n=1 Tax=Serratia TaxID=613 RepID=UPI00020E99DA|nr:MULTISPECIES: hypothetical protein [Serratia]AEF45901.1 hypothetical protein SerAS9_2781 [Serratia plymuthica AS9]AEF50852.1 hypothetical protein SerAS12_2782 [Serratia sp. AS12]AEG28559.1 hypothetical protein SerAS13_2783 [Serratia sp. AS13]UTN94651.1 hypothetical protein NLX81_14175 [Serratia plymuthica]
MRTYVPIRGIPGLPKINPAAGLLSDTMMVGYKMLSNEDFSGNGHHFSYAGSFNEQGAVLANDVNHIITTPVFEENEMTLIICENIPMSNPVASIMSNLKIDASPWQGVRLTKSAGAGKMTGQFDIAKTGNALTSATLQIDNGWMLKAYTWNGSNLRIIQRAGGFTDQALPSRVKGTVNPFRFNGIPANIGGGTITGGVVSGTLGPVVMYNEYMDVNKAVNYMGLIAQMMASRGVPGL